MEARKQQTSVFKVLRRNKRITANLELHSLCKLYLEQSQNKYTFGQTNKLEILQSTSPY